jgi:hypothetical protein
MRIVRFVAVGVLLLVAGCSNNKGKIVGKWESVNPPGLTMEFTEDGKVTLSNLGHTTTGKYSLGNGDDVFFKDLSEKIDGKNQTRETIKINGSELEIKADKDKWLKFKKAEAPKS